MRILWLALLVCGLFSCTDRNDPFHDPGIIRILEAKDHRQADSLVSYFSHPDSRYRALAVEAFASLQDKTQAGAIWSLLKSDTSVQVRTAAAFTLGFLVSPDSAKQLFDLLDELPPAVLPAALESYGRVGNQSLAKWFEGPDQVRIGAAWGTYRLGARGLGDSSILATTRLLEDPQEEVRLAAGYFFFHGRFQQPIDSTYLPIFTRRLLQEKNAEVRIAVAGALRKFKSPAAVTALSEALLTEKDVRCQVEILRSLTAANQPALFDVIATGLKSNYPQVAITSAEGLARISSTNEQLARLLGIADTLRDIQLKSILLRRLLELSPEPKIVNHVLDLARQDTSVLARAFYLRSLSEVPATLDQIRKFIKPGEPPLILSTASEIVAGLMTSQKRTPAEIDTYLVYIKEGFTTNDLAVIGNYSALLADTTNQFLYRIKDADFLKLARKNLRLPRDVEAIVPLEKVLSLLEGTPESPATPWNHPIDWEVLKANKDKKVRIATTRGDILLELNSWEAPGSVVNFITLAKSGYFNQKMFHRVVPDFVVQTGCNRGDSWGSEDYSIRSEISSLRYRSGAVGMASAGLDTEGTQWFITHSPTPRLEGNYTRFAQVIAGMDVVNQIRVGDSILSVTFE